MTHPSMYFFCHYDSSPYRKLVILSDKGMEVGHGSGQEQGGENLRWSYIETRSRHASLIPTPKIFW